MREQGKAGKGKKVVLGVHTGQKLQDRLVMESIRRTTWEVISGPVHIHQDITDVFRENYAIPQDFKIELHNAPDLELYADNQTQPCLSDSNIATWCFNILWQAVQRMPEADITE